MRRKRYSEKLAMGGMLVALAFIFSYLESLFPVLIPVPGIKLGLANLVTLIALYTMGEKAGFFVSVLRILLSGLTFGGFFPMIYSFAGGTVSFLGMVFLKNKKRISLYGVSIAGGALHNLGQIVVAAFVLQSSSIFTYLGILLPVGVLTGGLIGVVASKVLWSLKGYKELIYIWDKILAVGLVLIGLIVLLGVQITKREGGSVVVFKDASFYKEYSLFQNGVYWLEWENGSYNVLTIQDGNAFISEASCPDLLCVKEYAISRTKERIVCLPNRVEIFIREAKEGEFDAIVE